MAIASNPHGLKTQPSTQFATRTLQFLQIDMGTDVTTNYLNSDSLYSQAVRALQQVAELYGVGKPSGNWFTAIVSSDTLPYNAGQQPADQDRITAVETAINDATGASVNVWNSELNGSNLDNNC